MKALEFIIEDTAAGFDLKYSQHFFDRLKKRNIPLAFVNTIIKRLGRARRFINDNGVEKSVAVYDSVQGIHLIVKKADHDSNNLQIITVYKNDDYHGKTPVVTVR
jgi:hypothetical protein